MKEEENFEGGDTNGRVSQLNEGHVTEDNKMQRIERKTGDDEVENEPEDELHEDRKPDFLKSLDHLGVISAHHDGYIRFWNSEVI